MDVSLSVRFTAAERWEKGAARRVLIDSDLWSEPSLAEAASDSYVGAMGELVRLPPRCSASCRPNRHAMANGPLPELLRDLGIETLLDDPETLHRMAEVALDSSRLSR